MYPIYYDFVALRRWALSTSQYMVYIVIRVKMNIT
jgi:hypothetical protein